VTSRRFHVYVWFSALFICAPHWASGQGIATETESVSAVPPVVKISGSLKDSGGNAISGTVGITFGIYSQPTGGAPLWQETRNVQLDQKGGYSVLLGADAVGGIPLEVFQSGQQRWLSVQPSGQPEQPRRSFASVPYALQAGNSEMLGGLPPSAFLRANSSVSENSSSASTVTVGVASSAETPVVVQQQGVAPQAGVVNEIPKFVTSSSLGNSQIRDAAGVVSLQNLEHFVFADRFSGADLGAKINAAISSLGKNGGTVVIPAGVYTKVITTVKVNSFNISILGSGSNATQIDYTGNGDFIRIQMPILCTTCVAPQAGKISGLTINGTPSGQSGIHIGDVVGAELDDVVVEGFTGAAAAGIWFDNVTGFTERIQITRVWANQNTKGVRFTNSGGTASQISFGYERILDLRVDVGPSQTGISVESGNLYHSVITAVINVDRNHSGTAVVISGLGYVGGVGTQVDDNLYDLLAECTQCGGTATFLSIGPGASLTGTGIVDAYAMTNSIDPSATVFLYSPFIAGAPTAASSGLPVYMRGQPLGTNPDVPGAWVVPNGGPDNNWLMGFGNNVFWNGSAWQFHGDGVNNGGSAILGSYGDSDLGIYIIPTTGGSNKTVASGDLPKYEVADIGTTGITIHGNLTVTGTVAKGAGSFKIDHPLDPANLYLSHSFVESPDMMNIYNGNITTDKDGAATVKLPTYFEALNQDFRYQLTVIGQFAQAIVAREIRDNQFTIRTDHPFIRVSWQVTGVRHDAYAEAHRIPVEESKPAIERGHYLHPELFLAPSSSTTLTKVRTSH
jgi:trimeric autotransporter adhesin